MDKQWAGIIEPGAPPTDETQLLWWLLPILIAGLLALYYRQRPRPAMRRQLRHLRRRLRDNRLDRRNAGFTIAECLRRGRATTRLDRLDFGTQQAHWRAFLGELQQAQYRPRPPSQTELNTLLEEAMAWLRR